MGALGALNEDTTQKNKTVISNSEGSSVIGASLLFSMTAVLSSVQTALLNRILNGRYVSIELRYLAQCFLKRSRSTEIMH